MEVSFLVCTIQQLFSMRLRQAQHKQTPKKVLREEAQKLQNRLQTLRQQVQQQKQLRQKKSTETVRDTGSANTATSEKQTKSHREEDELEKVLGEKKLQHLLRGLRGRGVKTVNELRAVRQEDIDQWKDIAVGYRIKLKRLIVSLRKGAVLAPEVEQTEPETQQIEEIVQKRKKEKVYVVIQRQTEEEGEPESENLWPQDEDILLESLSTLIQPVAKSLSQRTVDAFPPSKFALDRPISYGMKAYPEAKYCWSCLKKVSCSSFSSANHDFCSQVCLDQYLKVTEIAEKEEFFREADQVQQSFTAMQRRRRGLEVEESDDLEVIDLCVA